MQLSDSVSERKILALLVGSALAILIANLFGKDAATTVTDVALLVGSGVLLSLAVSISARFGLRGDHGAAYFLFACFAAMWFSAELGWVLSELVLHREVDSIDWLYLSGYPFLFGFSVFYLKPLQRRISKKIIALGLLAAFAFLVPTIYVTFESNTDAGIADILWAGAYPIADASVLFLAVLGMSLYFRGYVSFFWSLACLAIILNAIADSGFMFTYLDSSYYTGHPIDILYVWAYILFSFGIYSHVIFYKKPKMELG